MGNFKLSHLIFANDLIMTSISNPTLTSFLQTILANFHSYIGLSINNEKSIICGSHSQTLLAF